MPPPDPAPLRKDAPVPAPEPPPLPPQSRPPEGLRSLRFTRGERWALLLFLAAAAVLLGVHVLLRTPRPFAVEHGKEGGGAYLVNINTEIAAELELLPGIGAKKAQAIIDHRKTRGDFRTLDDVARVEGIGKALAGKIAPLIRFDE